MKKIANLLKERQEKQRQLRDMLHELSGLYASYYDFADRRWGRQVNFHWMSFYELARLLTVPFTTMFVWGIRGCIHQKIGDILFAICVVVGYIVALRIITAKSDRRKTADDTDGEVYITLWFASQKNLNRVQAEIDHVRPEVDKLRAVYDEQQAEIARDNFIERLRKAQKVEACFKEILNIAKDQLHCKIDRKYSDNLYGEPLDVLMHVTVEGLADNWLRNGYVQELFKKSYEIDVDRDGLYQLGTYVGLLTGFTDRLCELINLGTQSEEAK